MADKIVKNNFDTQVDNYLGVLQNEYATAAISLFLILYAGVIAPKLPSSVLKWFDNWIVQIALFFAIVYISNKNATIALIAAIAVLVTLMIANNQITLKAVTDTVSSEKFCSACGGCDDDDDNDDDDTDPQIEEQAREHRSEQRQETMRKRFAVEGEMRPMRTSGEVEGILDEHVAEHDESVAGMDHAILGGATTSRGKPMMPSGYPAQRHYAETEVADQEAADHRTSRKKGGVAGVKQSEMEDETMGSSLDETQSMGSENASAEHNGLAPEAEREDRESEVEESEAESEFKHVPVSEAEQMVQESVEQVTSEVEHITGVEVSPETQEAVMSEVKQRVVNLANRGKSLGEFDVISVCREVYRRRY